MNNIQTGTTVPNLNMEDSNNATRVVDGCNFVEKYRARDFNTILGNETAIGILTSEITYGLYQPVKVFYGPPGSGKSTTAIAFSKLVNCTSPKEIGVPCDECASCKAMASGSHPDITTINASSFNGVDTAREIEKQVSGRPTFKKKIFILEEWQKMTDAALSALLTVMEQPTVSSATAKEYNYLFIMPTTELPKDTASDPIMSRAITINFYPASKALILKRLEDICRLENIVFESDAIEYLYKASNGAMRDCLKNLQSLATSSNFNITMDSARSFFNMGESFIANDLFNAIHTLEHVTVSSILKNFWDNSVIKELDFNILSDLFVNACNNATPYMHKVYTECLRVIRDNRIVFLKDPSRKSQENLMIACLEIINILRENLGIAVSDHIKSVDLELGNLLLSLNPNVKTINGKIVYTLNPPALGLTYILEKFCQPDICSVFNLFHISSYEFNNIGKDICTKIALNVDRALGEILFKSNPTTIVNNGELLLSLNSPSLDNTVIERLNEMPVKEILNSFGVSSSLINGVNSSINIPSQSTINTSNSCDNDEASIEFSTTQQNLNTASITEICNIISTTFDKNFGDFLVSLNPELLSDTQGQLILLIDRPTVFSNGVKVDIDHFQSFLLNPAVGQIFTSYGVNNYQYR